MDDSFQIWHDPSMLDLGDLQAFVRVAELGSISATARALRAPKSSVSRGLARLEESVGATLLDRTTRSLRLTDAGHLLHEHALRIIGDVDEAESALGNFTGAPRGTLRISAPYAFAVARLAPMLPAFLAANAGVQVVLEPSNRNVDLGAREADVAIRFGPLPDSELIARRLPAVAIWTCASPGYLAARGRPRADLAHHDVITHRPGKELVVGRDRVAVKPRAVNTDPSVSLAVLEAGGGIGFPSRACSRRAPSFRAR